MKNEKIIKILAYTALCALLPSVFGTKANAAAFDYGALTAAKYVRTESRRTYVDATMRQYIEDSAKLQSVLKSGKAVVFLFEGGSDNTVETPDYAKTRRDHAVILTVKNVGGAPQVVYGYGSCSTLPDDFLNYSYKTTTAVSGGSYTTGPAALLDGIYGLKTVNHSSLGCSFDTMGGSGYDPVRSVYLRSGGKYVIGASSGIFIHIKTSNHTTTGGSPWSTGCLTVFTSDRNTYNNFAKSVTDVQIRDNKFVSTGVSVGCVVVNRQLYREQLYKLYKCDDAVNALLAGSDAYPVCDHDEAYKTEGRCGKCGGYLRNKDNDADCRIGAYSVSGAAVIRSYPYDISEEVKTADGTVEVTGAVVNGLGQTWYKTADGYIKTDGLRFEAAAESELQIKPKNTAYTVSLGKACDIAGAVSSNYRLTRVTASLDGELYADIKPNSKTLDMGDASKGQINGFEAAKLSLGAHKITVTAEDESGNKAQCEITLNVTTTYDIEYDANGGSGAPWSAKKKYGTDYIISRTVPKRQGYDFKGWSEDKNAAEPEYLPGDKFTLDKNAKLYAVWEEGAETEPAATQAETEKQTEPVTAKQTEPQTEMQTKPPVTQTEAVTEPSDEDENGVNIVLIIVIIAVSAAVSAGVVLVIRSRKRA